MPKEASPQRQSRLYAITEHCKAHILMLKEEVNLMVDHPVGVAGHTGFLSEVENKLSELAEFKGMLDVLENEFK
jgi:hypothetical protein